MRKWILISSQLTSAVIGDSVIMDPYLPIGVQDTIVGKESSEAEHDQSQY
jgi:hypothetical protein